MALNYITQSNKCLPLVIFVKKMLKPVKGFVVLGCVM